MKRSRCNRIVVTLGLLAAGLPLHAESLRYQVKIDLGVGIYATKLNNFDQVLGERQGAPSVWSPGTGFTVLPSPIGAASDFAAVNLNDKGAVIGATLNVYGGPNGGGLFWASLLAAPITITQGAPIAINAKSHVALSPTYPQDQASIWSGGTVTALPKYETATLSPVDINDVDTVAAIGVHGDWVLVSNGVAHKIASLPIFAGVDGASGLYLNNAGVVAANSQHFTNSRQISRAVIWTPETGTVDLGTPGNQSSIVVGIDDHNRVLGYLDRDGGTPFVWASGMGMTELTSLIDLGDQYVRMQSVADINAGGEILGSLLDRDGRAHIVILMAVPEPGVWLIATAGMLGILFKCRRTRIHSWVRQRRGKCKPRLGTSMMSY